MRDATLGSTARRRVSLDSPGGWGEPDDGAWSRQTAFWIAFRCSGGTAMKQASHATTTIWIDGDDLAQEIAWGDGQKCLDLNTGEIRSADGIDGKEVGRARAGARADRRYIIIPTLHEAALTAREQVGERDAREIDACVDYLARLKARAGERGWGEFVEFDGDPDKMGAGERLAKHWLRSLDAERSMRWADPADGVVAVYDPMIGEWKDL